MWQSIFAWVAEKWVTYRFKRLLAKQHQPRRGHWLEDVATRMLRDENIELHARIERIQTEARRREDDLRSQLAITKQERDHYIQIYEREKARVGAEIASFVRQEQEAVHFTGRAGQRAGQ